MITRADDGERFAWLREKSHRRSALAVVEQSVARGDLDATGRTALAAELGRLIEGGGLDDRERGRVDRIVAALGPAEVRPPARPMLSAPRNRKPRRRPGRRDRGLS